MRHTIDCCHHSFWAKLSFSYVCASHASQRVYSAESTKKSQPEVRLGSKSTRKSGWRTVLVVRNSVQHLMCYFCSLLIFFEILRFHVFKRVMHRLKTNVKIVSYEKKSSRKCCINMADDHSLTVWMCIWLLWERMHYIRSCYGSIVSTGKHWDKPVSTNCPASSIARYWQR